MALIAALFGCSSPASDLENYFPEDYTLYHNSRLGSRLTWFIESKYSPDAMFETKDNEYFELVRPSIDGAAYYTNVGSFISGVKFPKRTLATVLVPHRTAISFDQPSRAMPTEVAIAVNEALTNAGFAKVIFLTLGYGEVQELYSKGFSEKDILCAKELKERYGGNPALRALTVRHMWLLQNMFLRAQSINLERFSLLQTGTVMTSTSLPPVIRDMPLHVTHLSRSESNKLVDAWQQPYYLMLSKLPSSASGLVHELRVWSSGENRSNEWGKGDDISTTFTNR